jgi:DNA replication protein DnaC
MYFLPAYELARAASEHSLGEGKSPVVQRALEASLLILDDLGAEPKIHNSPVPDVIYQRHARPELQTVITTGFDDAVLEGRYGQGIARRIFEDAELILTEGK